ncbi:MAG: radical SAM protein, partial [Atribacterota bacterium]|nr:radical SAM protein [Atribacterota bacterium]
PELQRKTGNKIDNSSFIKSIKILLKEGFPPENIRVYLLIGLPEQSLQSITDSVELVLDNGVRPYLAKYSPIPGTKMWKEIIKEYRWQEPVDPLWHNDALMPYFSPRINIEQYQQIKMVIQNFKL